MSKRNKKEEEEKGGGGRGRGGGGGEGTYSSVDCMIVLSFNGSPTPRWSSC